MNVMHFSGLQPHPCANTIAINLPLPHLNVMVTVRQYGEAKSTILGLDYLTVAGNIHPGRGLDHIEALSIQIKLKYAVFRML